MFLLVWWREKFKKQEQGCRSFLEAHQEWWESSKGGWACVLSEFVNQRKLPSSKLALEQALLVVFLQPGNIHSSDRYAFVCSLLWGNCWWWLRKIFSSRPLIVLMVPLNHFVFHKVIYLRSVVYVTTLAINHKTKLCPWAMVVNNCYQQLFVPHACTHEYTHTITTEKGGLKWVFSGIRTKAKNQSPFTYISILTP